MICNHANANGWDGFECSFCGTAVGPRLSGSSSLCFSQGCGLTSVSGDSIGVHLPRVRNSSAVGLIPSLMDSSVVIGYRQYPTNGALGSNDPGFGSR